MFHEKKGGGRLFEKGFLEEPVKKSRDIFLAPLYMVVFFYTCFFHDTIESSDILKGIYFLDSFQVLIDIKRMNWAGNRKEKCLAIEIILDLFNNVVYTCFCICNTKIGKKSIERFTLYLCKVDTRFCFTRKKYLTNSRESSTRFKSYNNKIIVFFSFLEHFSQSFIVFSCKVAFDS